MGCESPAVPPGGQGKEDQKGRPKHRGRAAAMQRAEYTFPNQLEDRLFGHAFGDAEVPDFQMQSERMRMRQRDVGETPATPVANVGRKAYKW